MTATLHAAAGVEPGKEQHAILQEQLHSCVDVHMQRLRLQRLSQRPACVLLTTPALVISIGWLPCTGDPSFYSTIAARAAVHTASLMGSNFIIPSVRMLPQWFLLLQFVTNAVVTAF